MSGLAQLEAALGSVEGALLEARGQVAEQVERRPYATLAAALGAGYLLAGGLFTPLTGRVLRAGLQLGLRALVVPLLQQELAAAAQAACGLGPPPGTSA